MSSPSPKERPSIFLRVFLSHLMLLLLSLVTAAMLFAYIFAPGVKMFMQHSPALVLPALLGLIGIAGMLSLWTAAAISLPIEDLTETLRGRTRPPATHGGRIDPGTAEVTRLAELLSLALPESDHAPESAAVSESATAVGSFFVDIDAAARITGHSASLGNVLGISEHALEGLDFVEVFSSGDARDMLRAQLLTSASSPDGAVGMMTTLERADGSTLTITWDAMNTFDALGGHSGRKLFGTPRADS